jgi:uncharacterized coiled-coil protein SlyX
MAFDLAATANATSEQKLDMLLAAVSTLLQGQEKIEKLTSTIVNLEAKVASQETTITSLKKDVKKLKEQANDWDQKSRDTTIRLFNFPLSDADNAESGRALAARVYDRILKPILVAAKAKGDTSSVPVVNNVIEDLFRVGKPTLRDGVLRPPPIIIKLCNRQLRLAILKNKRLSIPAPSDVERGNGIKKFIVVEDLTVPTFKKLSDLLADDRVEKAWSTDGRLRFVLMGDDKGVKKVKSVFDTTDEIINSASF